MMRLINHCLTRATASARLFSSSTAIVTEDLQTRLAHAGCEVDASTGALTPPIHPSSTFERDKDLEYRRGFVYARAGSPTRSLLERVLSDIETPRGAPPGDACAFASGVAVAAAVFQALPGGHVVLADDVYHGNRSLLMQVFEDWGLRWTMVDMTDLEAVERALGDARAAQRTRADRREGGPRRRQTRCSKSPTFVRLPRSVQKLVGRVRSRLSSMQRGALRGFVSRSGWEPIWSCTARRNILEGTAISRVALW